ncbi:Signal peptidase subunit [Ceraceosorus bombacis]|uniref:Signal peptidase complex subunit 1 n=1 Tax=Ceraceosorus bombacis TaxID=401625 RepID=A0A0P1BEJ4_9BASI|nr:Signal peptidase subunit [Ceraceosorus bombacis]
MSGLVQKVTDTVNAWLENARIAAEGKIPFQGQRLADRIMQELLVLAAVISFAAGYLLESLSVLMYIYGISTLLAITLVVPAWPMYKKNPVRWLPNLPSDDALRKGEDTKESASAMKKDS